MVPGCSDLCVAAVVCDAPWRVKFGAVKDGAVNAEVRSTCQKKIQTDMLMQLY